MRTAVALGVLLYATILGASAFAETSTGTTVGPKVPFRGCVYFEHIDFRGARADLRYGAALRYYVGDGWNDRISSIACHDYCRVTVFEHRDFRGARATFEGYTSYVGDAWNDRISSLHVSCRVPVPTPTEPLLPGMEDNTDRPGSDYRRFTLAGSTPNVCQQTCKSDYRCEAWTYVRPGVQEARAVCYLKAPAPLALRNNCCISGVVKRVNFERPKPQELQ